MNRKWNSACVSVLGLAAVLAGCGTSDRPAAKTTAGTPAAVKTAARPAATSAADAAGPITERGKAGETLTLAGSGLHDDPNNHEKTKIKVTLEGVRGPFNGYDVPAGNELVGVDLRFVNAGALRYDDPQPEGDLVVTDGESGKQTSLIPLSGKNPCSDASLKLVTGHAASVCIAYEIPTTSKPQTFQYITDSGYGDTGVWALR
jgi:hypothetical protein